MRRRTEVVDLSPEDFEVIVDRAVERRFAVMASEIATLQRLLAARVGFMGKGTLATLLGVSPRTLESWARERGLPVRRVGRVPVYITADVLEWLQEEAEVV